MVVSDLFVYFLKTYSYDFELTYRKGFRSSKSDVQVRVQACSPPKVTIDSLKSVKFNTKDEIVITGQVAAEALKVNLEYSFVSGDGMYRDQGSVSNRASHMSQPVIFKDCVTSISESRFERVLLTVDYCLKRQTM